MKPISEIWWCAVRGRVCLWPSLQLRRSCVVEWLDENISGWKEAGWRVAKLQVTEIRLKKARLRHVLRELK